MFPSQSAIKNRTAATSNTSSKLGLCVRLALVGVRLVPWILGYLGEIGANGIAKPRKVQVNDASQYVIMGIDDKLNILRFGQTCHGPSPCPCSTPPWDPSTSKYRGLSKRQMDQRYPNDGLRRAFWKKCAVCWVAGRYHERNVVDTICWGSKRTLGSVSYESIEPRFPARSKT